MAVVNLTEEQKNLIERLGVAHEELGLPPAAARIVALLLVSDDYELSFESIHETLNISKSSASTAISLLLTMDRIEYFTRHGERKRYFRVKIANSEEQVNERLGQMLQLSTILREIIDQRPDSTADFNEKLESLIGFLDFIRQELPVLFKRWQARKQ